MTFHILKSQEECFSPMGLYCFKMLNVSIYWTRCFESRSKLCLFPPSSGPGLFSLLLGSITGQLGPTIFPLRPWGPHSEPHASLALSCFFVTAEFLPKSLNKHSPSIFDARLCARYSHGFLEARRRTPDGKHYASCFLGTAWGLADWGESQSVGTPTKSPHSVLLVLEETSLDISPSQLPLPPPPP